MVKFKNTKSVRGNVLFMILIAVVLFGALSFATTRSLEGSGKGASDDNNRLKALTIMNFLSATEKGMNRMMLVNDCDISEINTREPGASNNTNARADGACDLFGFNGGQVTYQPVNANSTTTGSPQDFSTFAAHDLPQVGTNCTNSSCTDVFLYSRNVTQEICIAFNNLVGIDNPSGTPPDVPDLSGTAFTNGVIAYSGQVTNAALSGKTAGCVYESTGCGSGACHAVYQVLYAQ